ncbi:MAG: polymer-forming cytoskeletal protein [Acidobacteriota bacterium]|nr:polymer-forming cytoskeletal protein [Acidobacteriota bacterium]MDQ7088849.1 polymer-forming cytoskeletal protein [Acidobacteriota bacterium]
MNAVAPGEGFFQAGEGARLKGRITGRGAGVIHGEVHGELDLDGDLLVPAGGRFRFKAGRCRRLHLEGRGGGRLRVTGGADLAAGARFHGELQARRLDAAAGFEVEGELRVQPAGREGGADRTEPVAGA